jgi:hypothetical protein
MTNPPRHSDASSSRRMPLVIPAKAGTNDPVPDLLRPLQDLDLSRADARAGLRALLIEIERLHPGALAQQAAALELRRAGVRE